MKKKTISLLAVAVALGGFALAVFIPGASAQKANGKGTYTQYCEYTEYSQYGEYCEGGTTTTVIGGTTTVITSPTQTITNPGGTTTSTGGGSGVPAVIVLPNGSVIINLSKLAVGQTIEVHGLKITLTSINANGTVGVDFGGVDLVFPTQAAIYISKHGAVAVIFSTKKKSHGGHIAHAVVETITTQQDIVLPKGRTAQTFSFDLPSGVSFGSKTTSAQLAKFFTVQTAGGKKAINVTVKASANKARTAVTLKLSKPERAFAIKLDTSKFVYTKAEAAKLKKSKAKSLAVKNFSVKSTLAKGKSSETDAFYYAIPLS